MIHSKLVAMGVCKAILDQQSISVGKAHVHRREDLQGYPLKSLFQKELVLEITQNYLILCVTEMFMKVCSVALTYANLIRIGSIRSSLKEQLTVWSQTVVVCISLILQAK
jgi:hypothetical protein